MSGDRKHTCEISQIHKEIRALESRFDGLEVLLAGIAKAVGPKKRDPRFLPIAEAANLLGLAGSDPVAALRKRLVREARRPDGVKIRRRRGAVRRDDFLAYMKAIESRGFCEPCRC